MSIKVMSWVWENGPGTAAERLLLLSIADFCDDDGNCWPSMAKIAAKACVTERGARGIVRRLEAEGWVSVEVGGGRGGSSRYRVLMGNPEPQTGNAKPGNRNPEPHSRNAGAETRNVSAETRNGGSGEPSRTIKEPSKRIETRARDHLAPVLGDDLADAWLAHRKALRRPMTDHAGQLLAKRLAGMADPVGAVLRSIENGWQGIFEERAPASTVTPFPARRRQANADRLDDHLDALKARLAVQRLE